MTEYYTNRRNGKMVFIRVDVIGNFNKRFVVTYMIYKGQYKVVDDYKIINTSQEKNQIIIDTLF